MRKSAAWTLVALGFLCACRQEAAPGDTVSFEATLSPTKVTLSEEYKTSWVSGDEISVFGTSAYRFGTSQSGRTATFTPTGSVESGLVQSLPLALYPWNAANALSGTVLSAPLAASQEALAGDFPANQKPVLWARGTASATLPFAHATAAVRFTLPQDGVTRVVLEALGSAPAALSGTLSINSSDGSISARGTSSVSLQHADGTPLQSGTYYMITAPATLQEGITLRWMEGTAEKEKTTSAQVVLRAGTILNLGELAEKVEPITIEMTSPAEATMGEPYTLSVRFAAPLGIQKKWPKVVVHKDWTVFPTEMAANYNGWWPEVQGPLTEASLDLTFTETGEYEVMVYGPLTDGTNTFDPEGTEGMKLGTITVSAGESGGGGSWRYNKTGLADGWYDVSFTATRALSGGVVYVEATSGANAPKRTSLQYGNGIQHVIRGVRVSGGSCLLQAVCPGGTPAEFSISGTPAFTSSQEFTLLQGGDISRLNMMLDHGVVYRENGSAKDLVDIAVDNGWNIVRLRVFNDPGNTAYFPSSTMTAGYVNADDAVKLAAKAKARGLQILLSFHYSDYWTDALHQNVPHEWTGYTEAQLLQAVYDFTAEVLGRMKTEGTSPEYVSIGNETNSGLLFGGGTNGRNTNSAYMRQYDKFVAFFNRGAAAVRDVCPGAQVVVHAANPTQGIGWLFNHLRNYGADYDIIGLSYYPYWSGATVDEFVSVADGFAASYGRPVLVMETGFNWNTVTYYGDAGQLEDQGPYETIYPASPENQRNYLQELIRGLKGSQSIIGYIYWDPLTCPLKTWEGMDHYENGSSVPNYDNGTVTQNSSLFDFNGNRLPAWDAFLYN